MNLSDALDVSSGDQSQGVWPGQPTSGPVWPGQPQPNPTWPGGNPTQPSAPAGGFGPGPNPGSGSSGFFGPNPGPASGGFPSPNHGPGSSGFPSPNPHPSPGGFPSPHPGPGSGGFPSPNPHPSPGGFPSPHPGPGSGGFPSPNPHPSPGGFPSPHPGPGSGGIPSPRPGGFNTMRLPYHHAMPNGVHDKLLITIKGTINPNADKIAVDLGTSRDLAFHFNPRFNEGGKKVIVRNSCINDKWGKEERELPMFPFRPGQNFELKILCTNTSFKVAVDGSHLLEYRHRIHDLRSITKLSIYRDLTLSEVSQQLLP